MTTKIDRPLSQKRLYRYHDVIGLLSAAGPGFSGPVSVITGPVDELYVANRASPNHPEAVRSTR